MTLHEIELVRQLRGYVVHCGWPDRRPTIVLNWSAGQIWHRLCRRAKRHPSIADRAINVQAGTFLECTVQIRSNEARAALDHARLASGARAERDDGMAQSSSGADDDWKDVADATIYSYLKQNEYLFVDDLWAFGLPVPESPRALGMRMRSAAKQGLMENTGRFRRSVRSKMGPKPIWRSLIWDKRT